MIVVEVGIQKDKFFSMEFQKSLSNIAKNVTTYEFDSKTQTLRCAFTLQSEADRFSSNMVSWGK